MDEHNCNKDCKGYESYRLKGIKFWGNKSIKEIASLKDNWVPKKGMREDLSWEQFPHSSTIELHERKGRILQDVSVILGEVKTIEENYEDDLHTYHAAFKEMIASKMLNPQDLGELAGGEIDIESLAERKIEQSETSIQSDIWKMKLNEIQRIKRNKDKWNDAVKRCSEAQKNIIEESAKQLMKDKEANKINMEKVGKVLGLDRSTVSRTLSRIKDNYHE